MALTPPAAIRKSCPSSSDRTMPPSHFAEYLRTRGFGVRAIRPPTVPAGSARLRLSLTAKLSKDILAELVAAMIQARERIFHRARGFRFPMTGYFVTGTDTNVGKTVLSALLVAALDAVYWKPVQTGASEGTDRESVRAWAEATEERLPLERYRFDPPVSPHLAAREAGVRIALDAFRIAGGAGGPEMDCRGRGRSDGAAQRARPDARSDAAQSDSRSSLPRARRWGRSITRC